MHAALHLLLKSRRPNEQYHPYRGPGANRSTYLLPNFHGSVDYKKKVFTGSLHNMYSFSPGQSKSKHIPAFPSFQILIHTVQTHKVGSNW